jgi:hypothetical protein
MWIEMIEEEGLTRLSIPEIAAALREMDRGLSLQDSTNQPPLPRLECVFATIRPPSAVREHKQRLRERKWREIVNVIVIELAIPSLIRIGFPYYEEVLRGLRERGRERVP